MTQNINETGRIRILVDFTGYPGGATREHRRFFTAGEMYEGPQATLYVEKGLAIFEIEKPDLATPKVLGSEPFVRSSQE